MFSHPYISFFHLLVNVFLLVSVIFTTTLPFLYCWAVKVAVPRANFSCCGSYHLLQSCFSFFVRLLSRLVAVSNLGFLSNLFSSPFYNLLRMAKLCFLWSSVSFSRLTISLSFLCSSVSEALYALSFPFLSERFSSTHTIAALAYSRNE